MSVVRWTRTYRIFSRPFHSAMKRQIKAEKKLRDKEARVVQQLEKVCLKSGVKQYIVCTYWGLYVCREYNCMGSLEGLHHT